MSKKKAVAVELLHSHEHINADGTRVLFSNPGIYRVAEELALALIAAKVARYYNPPINAAKITSKPVPKKEASKKPRKTKLLHKQLKVEG